MKEKETLYYTPSINEFHIGFEYEVTLSSTGGLAIVDFSKETPITELFIEPRIPIWEGAIVGFDTAFGFPNKLRRSIDSIKEALDDDRVRVKYLNQEDVENLGYKLSRAFIFENPNDSSWISLDYFEEGKGWYISFDEEESQFSFQGWVKSKSQLRRLLEDNLNQKVLA